MNKITHEQARLLLREDMSSLGVYTLRTYITQQEKQEKLLELYRELAYYTRPIIIDDKYVELQHKIKELENDGFTKESI